MAQGRGLTVRIVFLTAIVFVCGIFTGLHIAESRHETRAATAMSGLEAAHERYIRRLVRDFDVDADQERKVRLVLEERARKQKDWWNDRLLRDDPRDRAALVRLDRTSEGLIKLVLNRPDQQAKYETMITASQDPEAPAPKTGMR